MKTPTDFIIGGLIIGAIIAAGWVIAIPVLIIVAIINNGKSDT